MSWRDVEAPHVAHLLTRAGKSEDDKLGPGIAIDGELGYTWLDTDPAEDIFFEGSSADHYDAFEIGIGTSLTFQGCRVRFPGFLDSLGIAFPVPFPDFRTGAA